MIAFNSFKPGDYVNTPEYGVRRVVDKKDNWVHVDVNFLPHPVVYDYNDLTYADKFMVGDILKVPINVTAEVIKVTKDYIILDVPDSTPVKLLIKDIPNLVNQQ